MNKIELFLLSCIILGISAVTAQDSPEIPSSENSVTINSIKMESTRSKGLSGLKILIELDEKIQVEHNLNIHYSLDGKSYTREYREMRPRSFKRIKIFHPFAILYHESGSQQTTFKLDSIYEPDKKLKLYVEGVRDQKIVSDVPAIRTIKIMVNYTKVTETNPKGKEWDYNLFKTNKTDTYPDLIYTIESSFNEDSRGIFGGQFYKTHKQKNTVIASWPYYSDLIYYCEGDELSLCVKDADTIFHDVIGCVTISKLLSMDRIDQLKFGSVINFSCEIVSD